MPEKQIDGFIKKYIPGNLSSVTKKIDHKALESVRHDMLRLFEEIVSIVSKIINEKRASTTEEEATLKEKVAYEKFQKGKFIYLGASEREKEAFSNHARILERRLCEQYKITQDQFSKFMKMKGLLPSC